jgi:hypothetical protein
VNWSIISTAELGTIIDLPLKISNAVLIAKDTPPIKVLCDTTLGQMLEASFGSSYFMGGPEWHRPFNNDLAKCMKEAPPISWGEASDEIANPRANDH